MKKSLSRYTPVPPILNSDFSELDKQDPLMSDLDKSSTRTSEEMKKERISREETTGKEQTQKTVAESKNKIQEQTLTDEQYLEKMLPELSVRMTHLNSVDDYLNKDCLDELNFLQGASRFGTFTQRSKVGDALTALGVAELFQRIWEKYFEKDFLGDENKLMGAVVTGILIVMWNFTDKCHSLCERVFQTGLNITVLNYLSSPYLDPSKTNQLIYKRAVSGLMGILHNMLQKVSESSESLREKKAVDIFQKFRNAPNEMIACKSLILQGYVITEKENEVVNSDDTTFQFIRNILENALKYQDHYARAYGFSAIEVIAALNRLAVNDNNQMRIVNAGLLPLYVNLLQPGNSVAEQAAAAEGLWTLEFKCMKMVEDEPGCVAALQNLVDTSSDENVVVQAKGALWKLQEAKKDQHVPHHSSKSDGRHVFISYQWDSKPVIKKLANSLKMAGYNVWVDFERMSGSILEAMALAVENAVVVVVCLTQKYKESPNCRTEAEYTFKMHKDILPLRLQPRYYPDGWLGALVGNKLVFDFSNKDKYDGSFKGLTKELGDRGKGQTELLDGPDVVTAVKDSLTFELAPRTSYISSSNSWSTEDVALWLKNNQIEQLKNWLHDIDGSLLLEYKAMRKNAPETFYSMLKENGFSLQDILKLNKAMNQL